MTTRIQLRRTKGWRKPAGSVVVSRPSKWGNPFQPYGRVEIARWKLLGAESPFGLPTGTITVHCGGSLECIALYRIYVSNMIRFGGLDVSEIRGRNLCCWCPLDFSCHADVLLEIANR